MAFFRLFGGKKKKQPRGPKFKVGERVKCIDDREHIIEFGKIYIVLQVLQLPCCGDYCYDVGLKAGSDYTNCGDCNKDIPGKGIRWAGEFRFAPNDGVAEAQAEEEDDIDAPAELMEQVKEVLEREHSMN